MNTRQINNKNMKRFAIGAGITAAALFLTAGLVAGIGGGDKAEVAAAPTTVVAAEVASPVAAEVPAIDETAAPVEAETVAVAAPAKVTPAAKSTKPSKQKKSAATGGNVVLSAPEAPAPTTAPAPAAAQESTPVATNPASQPAASQPAVEQPAAQQPAAASAPASNTNSGSTGSSTWLKVPNITGTPSLTSSLDLSKTLTTTVTIPKICVSIPC